jgi:IclR family pca regulon transcriptional regulator
MISSVAYAMKVIECLSYEAGGMLASELQQRSGVEKSVVSRIITTLQEEGYVRKDPKTELVRLTTRVPAIALRYLEGTGLLEMCQPLLSDLAEVTGELIQLATADTGPPIYVAKAQGKNRIQALPLIGTIAVPHASTAGKLWLASMSDFEAIAFLQEAELTALAPGSKTDPQEVMADVRKVRDQGYALITDELFEGVSAIAVPLNADRFVGALCLAMPSYRASGKALRAFLPHLRAKASELATVISFSLTHGRAVTEAASEARRARGGR